MIATQQFGRTGHNSSRVIFGAAALGSVSQADADRSLDLLLQYGVNHIDVAASYGDAETRIGAWLPPHRDQFFVATKTGERTKAKAREEIYRSLGRLRTDHVDLLQLHNLADRIEWQTALGPGGALEAAREAQAAGLVRFIGVTGHGLSIAAMHRMSLQSYDFDSVLLPYNYPMMQNPKYAADFEALLTLCRDKNVAVQTIKSIARRGWTPDEPHSHATWYAPLTEQSDIDVAVQWVLSRQQVFLNTAGDITLLPKILDAANRFTQSPDDAAIRAVVAQQQAEPLFV